MAPVQPYKGTHLLPLHRAGLMAEGLECLPQFWAQQDGLYQTARSQGTGGQGLMGTLAFLNLQGPAGS